MGRLVETGLETLPDDAAPSARLVPPAAQAAPTHPGAPPEPLGSLRWPHEPAYGRPEVENSPPFNQQEGRRVAARARRAAARAARRRGALLPLRARAPPVALTMARGPA